jgi:hypothetical protein
VAIARAAEHFVALESQAPVFEVIDALRRSGLGKGRPSASDLVFIRGLKERVIAASAKVEAVDLSEDILAHERSLGPFFAHYIVPLSTELLKPFGIALGPHSKRKNKSPDPPLHKHPLTVIYLLGGQDGRTD